MEEEARLSLKDSLAQAEEEEEGTPRQSRSSNKKRSSVEQSCPRSCPQRLENAVGPFLLVP